MAGEAALYSTGVPWKSLAISTARSWVRLVTKTCEAPDRRRWRAASSDIFPAPTIMMVRCVERAEDLARQLHRRVAHRNRHLPDAGFRAHPLGHAEGAREQRRRASRDSAPQSLAAA